MAVISFSDNPDHIWCVAGWVMRQILDDVVSQFPEDQMMAKKFWEAKDLYSGLVVDMLEPAFAIRVTNAIRQVAEGILWGNIGSGINDKPYGDATHVQGYRSALQELLHSIPSTPTEKN